MASDPVKGSREIAVRIRSDWQYSKQGGSVSLQKNPVRKGDDEDGFLNKILPTRGWDNERRGS